MCTHERLVEHGKKLVLELLLVGDHTVQKIKECLHDDALMSQDHGRVQQIFFELIHSLHEKGTITMDTTTPTDGTMVSFFFFIVNVYEKRRSFRLFNLLPF